MYHLQKLQLISILVLLLPLLVACKLKLQNNFQNDLSYEFTMYNALPWDISVDVSSLFSPDIPALPLIQIDKKIGYFDPCNELDFSGQNIIQDLVDKAHNVTNTAPENGWIAVFDAKTVTSSCNGNPPLYLFYGMYITMTAQRIGAKAVIWSYDGNIKLAKTNIPPEVDVPNRTVKKVKLNIPSMIVVARETQEHYFAFTKLNPKNPSTVNSVVNASVQWKMLSHSAIDDNPFEVLFNPVGVYRLLWLVSGLLSFSISCFIFFHIKSVLKYYENRHDQPSRMALRVRLLILVPELINGFVRSLASIDPLGLFYVYDFFFARIQFNLASSLSSFTDVITIFYCLDVYQIYKASRNMEIATPFMVKHKLGSLFVFTTALSMIVVDQIILILGLFGKLGSSTTIIPVLYLIFANISVMVILFWISIKMKQEVNITYKTLVETSKKSAETTGSKTCKSLITVANARNAIIDKTRGLLRMRFFIVAAACGRMATVFAFVLIGSGWYGHSAMNYGISLLLMMNSSIFSSYAQVFAALQLPHASSKIAIGTKLSNNVTPVGKRSDGDKGFRAASPGGSSLSSEGRKVRKRNQYGNNNNSALNTKSIGNNNRSRDIHTSSSTNPGDSLLGVNSKGKTSSTGDGAPNNKKIKQSARGGARVRASKIVTVNTKK